MKIEPEKFYSLLEVQKLTDTKSRQYLVKYIKDGLLTAIEVGKDAGKRYAVKGEWIQSFLERRAQGLVKGERYTIDEMKNVLKGAVEYCEKNGIKTLEEMIISINNLK